MNGRGPSGRRGTVRGQAAGRGEAPDAAYGAAVTTPSVPYTTVRAPHRMVASADGLATQAGLTVMARGGNAVDAAIATNAAIAVTAPHLCGMGGDLFALVHVPGDEPTALDASGRAGSGADPGRLRDEGHVEMPFRHDVRTVTIPGCVDGWVALHQRFGRLPLGDVLAPAIGLAEDGFPASPLLVGSLALLDDEAGERLAELAAQAVRPGDAGPPAGRGPHAAGHRRGRAGRLLRGVLRRGPEGPRTGVLHRRRPGPPPGRVGRAPGPRRLGASPLDAAPGQPGVPDAVRGVDRAGAAGAARPRRPALGPPPDRGRHRRRPRPSRGAPRSGRRDGPPRRRPPPPPPRVHLRRLDVEPARAPADGRRRHHLPVRGRRRPDGRSRSSSPTRPASAAGWSSPARASTSTTGAWASAWRRATRPSTDPAAARPTPSARSS